MSVTREEIAAFADGQLDPAREAEVAALVAADPSLAAQVRAHRALRERLAGHFAPVLDAPLPERLTAPLTEKPAVIDFASARDKRERTRRLPRWSWIAGPALAASLALAVFLPRGGGDYAGGALEAALETQLVASQDTGASNRILLSFRDEGGIFCRAFAGEAQSGIACREDDGWRLRMTAAGVPAQQADYRMADNPAAEVLERAQGMAAEGALDAAEERAARARGWRCPLQKPFSYTAAICFHRPMITARAPIPALAPVAGRHPAAPRNRVRQGDTGACGYSVYRIVFRTKKG